MDASGWMASLNSGLLPKFQLLVAVISIANSIQGYITTKYSARVYVGAFSSSSSSSSRSRTRSSRKATASPPPAQSTRSKTPSKALPPADEPVAADDAEVSSSPPGTTAVVPRTRRAKPTSPVTPFAARLFGNWTVLSGIIRLYCALNISDPLVYQLALWTYVVVIAHYVLEMFVFATTGPAAGSGIVGPAIIGPTALLWMLLQWGYYVK